MREVICIHIGGCGCRLGMEFWELLAREHGIQSNGQSTSDVGENDTRSFFFRETSPGKYVARAVFADLEPTVVDTVRAGSHHGLFAPGNLISKKEDAAAIYARGRYTVGPGIIDRVMDQIQREAEKCSDLGGFIVTHSLGGGTGSGFAALLLERLSRVFSGKPNVIFSVLPSPQLSTSVTESYNTVLYMNAALQHAEVTFVLDNGAAYDIGQRQRGIERPQYADVNRIMAQAMLDVTRPWCRDGESFADVLEKWTSSSKFAIAPLNGEASQDAEGNSEAVICLFKDRFFNQMLSMQATKAFVHMYIGDGMEEAELDMATEAMNDLLEDLGRDPAWDDEDDEDDEEY